MENNIKPILTVFMPVYNGEKYLAESIKSILNQNYHNFTFLIINDGSTDSSNEIIKSFKDKRIRYVYNKTNRGLAYTRNIGLAQSDTKYLAFQDCDDISYPNRLKKQIEFLIKNPSVGAVGNWIKNVENNKHFVSRFYQNPDEIKANLLFFTSIAQPTVMINRELFLKNNLFYDDQFVIAEDYDLFSRASRFFDLANIPEVLLKYRIHKNNISKKGNIKFCNSIRTKQLIELDIIPDKNSLLIHTSLHVPSDLNISIFLSSKEKWLSNLIQSNKKKGLYKEPYFSQIILENWIYTCEANSSYGISIFFKCTKSKLFSGHYLRNLRLIIILFIKTITKHS